MIINNQYHTVPWPHGGFIFWTLNMGWIRCCEREKMNAK